MFKLSTDSNLRNQLLANMTDVLGTAEGTTKEGAKVLTSAATCDRTTKEGVKVFTYAAACDRCFQPEIAQLCTNLMTSQAEVS